MTCKEVYLLKLCKYRCKVECWRKCAITLAVGKVAVKLLRVVLRQHAEDWGVHTNYNWGIFVLNHSQVLAKPLELILNNDVVVVSCTNNILAFLHLLGLLVAVTDIVEHNVVHIANVERVVSWAKCLAIWLCSVKIGTFVWNSCTIVVVVTHCVENWSRVAHLLDGVTEIVYVKAEVVPEQIKATIAHTHSIYRYSLALVLLNLGTQARHNIVLELRNVVELV